MFTLIKSLVYFVMETLGFVPKYGSDFSVRNDEGKVIFYKRLSDNTCAVFEPKLYDLSRYKYRGDIVIPSSVRYKDCTYSVTEIDDRAFITCSDLTSIVIPGSVTKIGDVAFFRCSGLRTVDIPRSVTEIGEEAFTGCIKLDKIYISGDDNFVFKNDCLISKDGRLVCGLNKPSIVVPESVTMICDFAFAECNELTSIVLPESVTEIGCGAFSCCSKLTSVVIPASVTYLIYTFQNCSSLSSITIPDSVTAIDEGTFSGCSSLTSVVIPGSVTILCDEAFAYCPNLASIVLPASVTKIHKAAFLGSSQLDTVILADGLTEEKARQLYDWEPSVKFRVANQ